MLFPLLVISLSSFVLSQSSSLSNVTAAFQSANIVPDVLPHFEPSALLGVVFTDPVTMQSVNVTPGILITTEQTSMEPQFFLALNSSNSTMSENQTYVLAIVDPDAPTPQNTSISQFRHFLGGGFTVGAEGSLSNTTAALSDFFPPTPPAGSDPHRYVVLLYIQSEEFASMGSSVVNASTDRMNFNITTFAQQLDLEDPIGGNFFLTGPSNDTTVSASATTPAVTSSASLSTNTAPTSVIVPVVNSGQTADDRRILWGAVFLVTVVEILSFLFR